MLAAGSVTLDPMSSTFNWELRAFLARAWTPDMRDRDKWHAVARWVDSLKLARLREGLATIDSTLDTYLPVEVRTAMPHWVSAALKGDERSRASLCLVRNLNLRAPKLGDNGLVGLARLPQLCPLRRLKLHDHQLSDRAAFAIAKSPAFRQLERVNLAQNRVSGRGALALLVQGSTLLDHLYLGRNRIDDAGALALADQPECARLLVLDLSGNPLQSSTRQALKQHPNLSDCELRVD